MCSGIDCPEASADDLPQSPPQGQCRVLGRKGGKGKLTAPRCGTVLSALINRGVVHIVVECGRELYKLSWNIVQSGCEPAFPNA